MFSRAINWIDDRLNPIVVKELRQSMNGKTILGITLLFLTVELILFMAMTMDRHSRLMGSGMEMFTSVISLLMLACVLGVAAVSSLRFQKECQKDSMDLVHTTALPPHKVISGKVLSAMIMVVYLFSLSVPFMCIAYFMRGVSIPVILYAIYMAFMCLIPLIALAILIGSLNLSIIFRIAFLIAILWAGGTILMGLIFAHVHGADFIGMESILITAFYTLALAGACYVLAIASISHPGTNRLVPFKIYIFILWLLSLIFVILVFNSDFTGGKFREGISAWFSSWMIIASVLCASSAEERLEQSIRVLKKIPVKRIWRVTYFLFSTGSLNTIFFSLFLASITFITSYFSAYFDRKVLLVMSGLYTYFLFYAGTTLFIRNRLKNIFPRMHGFAYFMGMLLLFTLIPLLVLLLIYLDFYGVEKNGALFFIMSPASLSYSDTRIIGLVISLIGCMVVFLLNMNYCRSYCRQFFCPRPNTMKEDN
jgi:hypothetical protein